MYLLCGGAFTSQEAPRATESLALKEIMMISSRVTEATITSMEGMEMTFLFIVATRPTTPSPK